MTSGTESKVYYVSSDQPVTVSVSSHVAGVDTDATTAYPLATRHYVVTVDKPSERRGCRSFIISSFYTVSARFDGTRVEVYRPIVPGNYTFVDSFTLNRFQAYTNTTQSSDEETEFAGYYISSTQPVSVSAGSLCTPATVGSTDEVGVAWSYMPPESMYKAGPHLTFQITTILSDVLIPNYYQVLVLASQDSTAISSSSESYTVNTGALVEFSFLQTWDLITCSRPCLVLQINLNSGDNSGIFILHVPHVEAYSEELRLTAAPTPSTSDTHYVRLLSNTPSNKDNLGLTNLAVEEDWTCTDFSSSVQACHLLASVSDVSKPSLVYNVRNTSLAGMAAAVYVSSYQARGYGYSVAQKGKLSPFSLTLFSFYVFTTLTLCCQIATPPAVNNSMQCFHCSINHITL